MRVHTIHYSIVKKDYNKTPLA